MAEADRESRGRIESLEIGSRGQSSRLRIHAKPRSAHSRVAGVREGALVVTLHAPPVEGAANEELVRVLAQILGLARRQVAVVSGSRGRSKIVELDGVSPAEVRERLHATLACAEGK